MLKEKNICMPMAHVLTIVIIFEMYKIHIFYTF